MMHLTALSVSGHVQEIWVLPASCSQATHHVLESCHLRIIMHAAMPPAPMTQPLPDQVLSRIESLHPQQAQLHRHRQDFEGKAAGYGQMARSQSSLRSKRILLSPVRKL